MKSVFGFKQLNLVRDSKTPVANTALKLNERREDHVKMLVTFLARLAEWFPTRCGAIFNEMPLLWPSPAQDFKWFPYAMKTALVLQARDQEILSGPVTDFKY